MSSKLRKKNTKMKYQVSDSESDWSRDDNDDSDWNRNEDYKPKEVGGKKYEKAYVYSLTDKSCTLADRRMTSIRQQSDQLCSALGENQIAASPTTVYPQDT